jgi:pyruvate dehydrogenase E1 component beta subunit
MLLGVPGLKIIMPSNPHDAKGLMLSAIADNNPIIIIEHRWLMRSSGYVPKGFYKVPIGKANVLKKGSDITIISTSYSLELVKKASLKIQKALGISCEIIDLRTVKPYDKATILKSVKKTKRLMVVDYDWPMGGIASEIISFVSENLAKSLIDNPVKITLPETPVPAGYYLEKNYFFDESDIINRLKKLFN